MSILAPFRFMVAIAMALLIATITASSTAHAMLLGEASAQSTLGAPLRVVIPIKAMPDESLDPGCFRIVPNAANASAPAVTARVSLERAAATPRLVVSTPDAVTEPAVQFTLQAGCDGTTRRNYVLLLDPPLSGAAAVHTNAHTTTFQSANPTPREPRQERSAVSAPMQKGAAARAETLVVQAPVAKETSQSSAAQEARGGLLHAIVPASLRHISVTPVAVAAEPAPPRPQAASTSGWNDALSYLAASLAILGVIGLAALFMRQRNEMPEAPEWTRGGTYHGPRTETNLSMTSETLSHTQLLAAATTIPSASSSFPTPSSMPSAPAAPVTAAPKRQAKESAPDPSSLDTLLGDVDPDVVEERAVRDAWAAARIDVEGDAQSDESATEDNHILRAIADAERDLLLAPPPPAQAAMESSLDDDLLRPRRRPDKAAA